VALPSAVFELSDPYANFMRNPVSGSDRVCPVCFGFKQATYKLCIACDRQPNHCDAIVPITYSLETGQVHHALRHYKDDRRKEIRTEFTFDLTAILWRFLAKHETCAAESSGTDTFDMVTVVPSGQATPDSPRPRLTRIVEEYCEHTAPRFRTLLERTDQPAEAHCYKADRFDARDNLTGESVLLIDDTWTTGASVQSAARTLKSAGASKVGAVVIGRHVNGEFDDHGALYRNLREPFDWDLCAVRS